PWWAPSLLVLTTSSAGAAGDCFVVYPGTGVAFGSSAVIAMTVPKGTVCAEPVRVGAGQITSLRVKVRAQRGVAGVQGTTRFAYKAPNEPG
ncbi:hypothetical protein, partial [Klebsiella pneumoniae]|uniref:hypothetical protein n=1 Tax=Klebsiella pneumoniae TaxID=573 RepID=UPI00351FB70D